MVCIFPFFSVLILEKNVRNHCNNSLFILAVTLFLLFSNGPVNCPTFQIIPRLNKNKCRFASARMFISVWCFVNLCAPSPREE